MYSLTQNPPGSSAVFFRYVYEENVASATCFPLLRAEEVIPALLQVLCTRREQSLLVSWHPGRVCGLLGVFGAMIQFTDSHTSPLPNSIFPPQQNVLEFIKAVKALQAPVTPSDQFSVSLNIVGGNVFEAVRLCWISTRFMARGADQRVYPGIPIDADELRAWNQRIARFEVSEASGANDGPGDSYYFWTQVLATIIFGSGGVRARMIRALFSKGTRIMTFVRNRIARKQPNMTTHEPASSLGIAAGYALLNLRH